MATLGFTCIADAQAADKAFRTVKALDALENALAAEAIPPSLPPLYPSPNASNIFFDFGHAATADRQAEAEEVSTGVDGTSVARDRASNWRNIPIELRERKQWCICKSKDDKTPRQANGRTAKVTDPATWTTFDEARERASIKGWCIGYVLTADDPFTCIDLDVKADTPQQTLDGYHNVIRHFASYTERSVSSNGYHIWVKGKKSSRKCRRDGVEVYSQDRFIICTGDTVDVEVPTGGVGIASRQEQLDALMKEIWGNDPGDSELVEVEPTQSDEAVLHRCQTASNSDKFNKLASGDWQQFGIYPSQSEADFALLNMIAFFTESNEQVKRVFRMTELGKRDKATKNDVYLDRTLKRVRAHQVKDKARTEEQTAGVDISGLIKKADSVGDAHMGAARTDASQDDLVIPTPKLRAEAYHGILGEIAKAGSEHTEAVPAAIAINILARFCATLGPSPYIAIGDDFRNLRLFALVIGPTSKGRKGTSAKLPERIFEQVDIKVGQPLQVETGVSTGQGLVAMVRDPRGEDPGVLDKRVLLELSEFAGVLAQAKNETSILTAILRDAWDGRCLSTPNKTNPCKATGAHFVVLGHITAEELLHLLKNNEIKNGFANRFMMTYSARERIERRPKPTSVETVNLFAERIAQALRRAWNRRNEPLELTESAYIRWEQISQELEERPQTSNMQSLMARADTYVLILAGAIALLNLDHVITPTHLNAALAWIDFWEDTANFCFTTASQYDEIMQLQELANQIVETVRKLGSTQVSRHDIWKQVTSNGSNKNINKEILDKAIKLLQNEAPPRVVIETIKGKGRPKSLFSLAR